MVILISDFVRVKSVIKLSNRPAGRHLLKKREHIQRSYDGPLIILHPTPLPQVVHVLN